LDLSNLLFNLFLIIENRLELTFYEFFPSHHPRSLNNMAIRCGWFAVQHVHVLLLLLLEPDIC
jgi:hypothetical protein